MIFLTGDTHGEEARLLYLNRANRWTAEDTLIVCGDFGYVKSTPEARAFLDLVETWPFTLCFLDGNHENFPLLNSFPVETWHGGRIHRIRRNVIHLMRGQVFTLEHRTFFTFGGAYSRDRDLGKEGVDWWPEELPCAAEYAEARENLARHQNTVDYMLTHTAPLSVVWQVGMKRGFLADTHDLELMKFLDDLRYDVTWSHWYFGHFHDDFSLPGSFTLLFMDVEKLS